jgi:WD40 repeat protein
MRTKKVKKMQQVLKLFSFFLISSAVAAPDSLIKMLEPYEEVRSPYELDTGTLTAVLDATVASTTLGATVNSVHWHPTGQWLAVGGLTPGLNSAQVQIFAMSATGTALYTKRTANIIHGGTVNEVRWSPDGNYLAICGVPVSGVTTRVFKFNYDQLDSNFGTTSKLTGCDINYGSQAYSLDWSPDGQYLVVGGKGVSNADHIKTYSFDGRSLYALPDTKATYTFTLGQVNEVRWHPSGDYIGFVGNPSGPAGITTQVYAFNETYLHYLRGCDISFGVTVHALSWSPDGAFLRTGGEVGATGGAYSFDGKKLVNLGGAVITGPVHSRAWSPDQAYRLFVETGTGQNVIINENTQGFVDGFTHGADLYACDWSKDGSFIAVGGATSGGITVRALQFSEDLNFALKKQKNEVIYLNKLLASVSSSLPAVSDLAMSTSFALDQVASFSLTSITTVTQQLGPLYLNTQGGGPGNGFNGLQGGIDWHPSGEYLAFSFSYTWSAAQTQVFQVDYVNGLLQTVATISTGFNAGGPTRWSPDGKFLMINGGRWKDIYNTPAQNSPQIYNFDEVQLRLVDNLSRGAAWDAHWFPSVGYIASCESSVFVDQFDGLSLTAYTNSAATASNFQEIAAPSPNGQYVGFGGENEVDIGNFIVYQFDPLTVSLTGLVNARWFPPVAAGWTSAGANPWHPSGNYILLSHTTFSVAGDYIFLLSFDGSSVTEVTTARQTFGNNQGMFYPSWDPTGRYVAAANNTGSGKITIYEFDGSSQLTQIFQQATVGGENVQRLAWSPDGQYLATQTATKMVLYHLNFSQLDTNEPTLLLDTSNAASGLLVDTSYAVTALANLAVANSYAMVNLRPLVVTTSNALVTYVPLIKNTSNAISGLLVQTSQAANALLVADSLAVVSLKSLAVGNSNTLVTMFPIAISTSNAMKNYAPLIVNTSNALNGLLVATSNAAAGLLVATSNAAGGLLAVTSNAVATLVIGNSNAAAGATLSRIGTIDHGPANVHFSSATVTMSYDLRLGQNTHSLNIHTSGVVDGNGHLIDFARAVGPSLLVDNGITVTFQNVVFKDFTNANVLSLGTGAALIFGQNCTVEMPSAVTLSRTWSFAGSSRLKGFGYALDMSSNYIAVLPQSRLKIEDITLNNLQGNNLRCINDNSSIQFENVIMTLSSDFTFTTGSMKYTKDVTLRGTSIFNYQTNMGSTIDSGSKLMIDQSMTFNYAPANNLRNLLVMTDSTSVLSCNNATLVSTATGIQLTKGTLFVDGVMKIQSAAASSAEAVIFGDGTPVNDLLVRLMPGAGVQLISGYLSYKNAN